MDPLQMLPEVVCTRPFLFLLAASRNDASIALAIGTCLGVAASFMPIDVVRCAEAFNTCAAGDIAVVRFLVFLLVLP